jgi:rhodanese-related sulfurtransferase
MRRINLHQQTKELVLNKYNTRSFVKGCALLVLAASMNVYAEGNRYDLPRNYHSEISAAKAYILSNHNLGNVAKSDFANAVIIDVRTVEEYGAGHAPKSYNIPFPHIHSRPNYPDIYIPQDPVQYVNDVMAAFPDRSTPILTMCRTGYRSVLAANLLADAGYTDVRNIWQGFVGNTKVDTAGNILDLNNNGVDGDAGDKDGWSGYQELPVDTKLLPQLIYAPYEYLYYE